MSRLIFLAIIIGVSFLPALPMQAGADVIECDASVIDVGTAGVEPASGTPLDIYVTPDRSIRILPKMTFKVYRPVEVNEPPDRRHPLKIYFGRLQTIDVQGNVLIGRMIDFAPKGQHPSLRYESIMVGDCLVMESPTEPFPALEVSPDALPAEELDFSSIESSAEMGAPSEPLIIPTKVLFKFDKSDIEEKWTGGLDELAGFILARKPTRVVIEGHACWIGTDKYNIGLSKRRARAMIDYLVRKHEIPREVFEAEAYGESRPEVSNKTTDGRRRNRRAIAKLYQFIPTIEAPPVESSPDVEPVMTVEPERMAPEEAELPLLPVEPPPPELELVEP